MYTMKWCINTFCATWVYIPRWIFRSSYLQFSL